MKIIKSKKMQETLLNVVLVVGGLFLVAALLHYGNNKSTHKDMMVSGGNAPKPSQSSMSAQSSQSAQQNKVNVVSPQKVSGNSGVQATTEDIFDQTFAQVGASSLSGGSVQKQVVTNPNELMPKIQTGNSSLMNPPRNGLQGKNFLTAENHLGINTVGGSLRNANQQLRSDPQIPMSNNVGPWLNSTIEPDNMRRSLEIGGNCN